MQQGDRSHERSLDDRQVLKLAQVGLLLEENYASPRDIEWAFHAVSSEEAIYNQYFPRTGPAED